MKALLLIGGMATRLVPLSKHLHKSLLPVCDREILHYQVSQLARGGISEIVLAAGHLVDQLRDYVGNYSGRLKFHISDEPEPCGTAGAIAQAREQLAEGPVVVLNADILSSISISGLISKHKEGGRLATVVGYGVDDPSRYGLLKTAGGEITGFSEKPDGSPGSGPHYINAGAYVLEPEVVQGIPADRPVSIERETFPQLIAAHGSLTHFLHEGLWIDIGTFESYFAANFSLLARRYAQGEDALWGTRDDAAIFKDLVYIHKAATLGEGVDLFHRVIVMAAAQIGDGCRLHNCVVLPGAKIGAGSRLATCIIGPGATVEAGAEITNLVLVKGEEDTPFFPETMLSGQQAKQ
ncbi:NDP-sugar synthase [bacterium]|nr:NDP-sugar synthase [bacterium]